MRRQLGKYKKQEEVEQGEVTTFNLFDLSWHEIEQKGLDKHIDKETYVNYKENNS